MRYRSLNVHSLPLHGKYIAAMLLGQKTASEMHVAPRIVVHCCSWLSIVVIHCGYHRLAPDGAVIETCLILLRMF